MTKQTEPPTLGILHQDRPRYLTIDIARAIAIILVVIGHYYEPSMPSAYKVFVRVIYMFHMPLFMFISGFLYIATRQYDERYDKFIIKKFNRLMVPYFSASIIIILIKLTTQSFISVDHPVELSDFIAVLYFPAAGYFLWFLWALWWSMVVIPFFRSPKSRILLLGISLVLNFIAPQVSEIFCLSQFCTYLIYFVLGTITADIMRARTIVGFTPACKIASIALFAVLSTRFYNTCTSEGITYARNIVVLTLAVAGIAMTLSISNMLVGVLRGLYIQILLSISSASFFIYQYHTTFEGFAKGLLRKFHFFDGAHIDFLYTIAIIMVTGCGVVIPWLIDRLILSCFAPTRRIFGLSKPK